MLLNSPRKKLYPLVQKVKENSKKEVFVTIKNTGQGIHRDILPRRFASKTFQGTELRVFISKNIVEAHGGKIWAERGCCLIRYRISCHL